jgi:hypothetical protein
MISILLKRRKSFLDQAQTNMLDACPHFLTQSVQRRGCGIFVEHEHQMTDVQSFPGLWPTGGSSEKPGKF